MKIEGDRLNLESTKTDRPDGTTAPAAQTSRSDGTVNLTPATDQVQLSPKAQLLQAALRAAESEPAVRQSVVDGLHAALDSGLVGHDASRLADALIGSWLDGRS